MAIKIGDFVSHLKRESKYGQSSVTNDQATTDILSSINKRLAPIWARAEWHWGRELLSFALTTGTRQYVVTAASGNAIDRIQDLIPYDSTGSFLNGKPLTERTSRQFFTRHGSDWGSAAPVTSDQYGPPAEYYNVGLDSNGAWNVVLWPTPGVSSKMGGYAKGVLSTYTNADIVANNPILYFPNAVVLDALFSGCMIDIALIQGMTVENSFTLEIGFEAKIKRLVTDQIGVSTDNTPITTSLPATVDRLRSRGGRRRNRW